MLSIFIALGLLQASATAPSVTIQRRHGHLPKYVAVSDNGRMAFSVANDLKIWWNRACFSPR